MLNYINLHPQCAVRERREWERWVHDNLYVSTHRLSGKLYMRLARRLVIFCTPYLGVAVSYATSLFRKIACASSNHEDRVRRHLLILSRGLQCIFGVLWINTVHSGELSASLIDRCPFVTSRVTHITGWDILSIARTQHADVSRKYRHLSNYWKRRGTYLRTHCERRSKLVS